MPSRIPDRGSRPEIFKGGVLPTTHVSAPMPPVQQTRPPQAQTPPATSQPTVAPPTQNPTTTPG